MNHHFFDHRGVPVAYTDDGEHIYTLRGKPVAYLHGDSVYGYSGTHLGWFENGLIRDHDGQVVLFTPGSSDGPVKPIRSMVSLKGIKGIRPIKGVRQTKPLKPIKSPNWSLLSGDAFFQG